MPDSTNNTWIDTTFIESTGKDKDIGSQLKLASADVIGMYSVPTVYRQVETTIEDINVLNSFFQELNTMSGVANVATAYRAFEPPKIEGLLISLAEFGSNYTITSGTLNKPVIYTTGYNSISGTLDKYITFVGGREMLEFIAVSSSSQYVSPKLISKDWWVNYTDFSGNLTSSGTPIPFNYENYSYITEYYNGADNVTSGSLNKVVDISFAGWVDFSVYGDVYSSLLRFIPGYKIEATTISGNVNVHYMDLFSTLLTTSGIECNVYCVLTDYSYIPIETEIIPGRIGYIETDIYSTIKQEKYLTMDIDLLSLKISNFSLGIGEYTTASGFISVDITDDECPVSTSGTYFMVDGIQASSTFSGINDGYRMFYNPEDDFSSLEGPTVFTVHAENECGKILEQDFYLTFGYIVEYINRPELSSNMDYGFGHKIAVRVVAENYASCPQTSSLAWEFESKPQFNNDLRASIVGRFHAWDYNDMLATIYPQSTAYFYGKEFRVVVKAKDFAGNQMEPLILAYRIEDKP